MIKMRLGNWQKNTGKYLKKMKCHKEKSYGKLFMI